MTYCILSGFTMDHYTILIQYRPVWSIWYRQRERTSVTCGRRQISSIILTLKKQKQHSRLLKIRYWFCCVYMILIRKVSRSGLEKLPVFCVFFCVCVLNRLFVSWTVLALTVEFRKSQDFQILTSGSPGYQIVSLTSKRLISIFLNSHLWSKTAIFKLNNIQILPKFFLLMVWYL